MKCAAESCSQAKKPRLEGEDPANHSRSAEKLALEATNPHPRDTAIRFYETLGLRSHIYLVDAPAHVGWSPGSEWPAACLSATGVKKLVVPEFDADAAIKIQRNTSGAFACHYDNAGPPSKRSVTAVLYLGRADGAAVAEDDGGALCLAPFLRRRARLRPLFNRLVLFKSDRVLHSVERWRGASPRLCVSFWFEGPVNAPEDLVLTRDRLRFSGWDAAADFFMHSPVQRTLSRAVSARADIKAFLGDAACRLRRAVRGPHRHTVEPSSRRRVDGVGGPWKLEFRAQVYDDDYRSSIRDMRSDGEQAMLAGHARVVEATVKSLKPLVEELRRRRVLIGADLEL